MSVTSLQRTRWYWGEANTRKAAWRTRLVRSLEVPDPNWLTAEITAVRDGLDSWQPQVRAMDRTGYGLHYGNYYGGL